MTPVLLSNPGLPLAIYGNPGPRRGRGKRRSRRNPVFLGPKAGMWATNPGLKRALGKRFKGWRIASVKVVRSKRRKSRRSRSRATRRNPRKAPMARTKSRRRRARVARSKRTGRFLSRRTRRFQRRRARYTVGRTYRRKGAWVKVQRAHVRRRKGRRVKNRAVKWSGRKGKILYSGIGGRKGRKGIRRMRFTNPRRRRGRARRNPSLSLKGYLGGITGAPKDVLGNLKHFTLKKGISLGLGTVATYVAGGIASRFASPYVAMIPVLGTNPLFQRVAGAAFPYTVAFIAAKAGFLGKYKSAALLGGAVASILEFIVPGQVASWVQRIPGLSAIPGIQGIAGLGGLSGSAAELAGYVQAPSYAGVGAADALAGYVQAPSYAGVGQADALAGYVQAPSYAGVGNADYLTTDDYVPKASYLN